MRILTIAFLAALASVLSALGAETLSTPVPVLGDFVRLTLTHNPDIAFSIMLPAVVKEILIGAALLGVLYCAFHTKHDAFSSLAFGLIIGGAISNLFDRIPDGIVTDFISIGTFPIFNVPDACITIGAGMLLLESMRQKKHVS